mmetsp:Transcript_30238/g.61654  ORF Transcript_30238/g.61654 Transcript_30238/m.61654 type:complete len:295 (+) Transcript_30238:19-903(+)
MARSSWVVDWYTKKTVKKSKCLRRVQSLPQLSTISASAVAVWSTLPSFSPASLSFTSSICPVTSSICCFSSSSSSSEDASWSNPSLTLSSMSSAVCQWWRAASSLAGLEAAKAHPSRYHTSTTSSFSARRLPNTCTAASVQKDPCSLSFDGSDSFSPSLIDASWRDAAHSSRILAVWHRNSNPGRQLAASTSFSSLACSSSTSSPSAPSFPNPTRSAIASHPTLIRPYASVMHRRASAPRPWLSLRFAIPCRASGGPSWDPLSSSSAAVSAFSHLASASGSKHRSVRYSSATEQ